MVFVPSLGAQTKSFSPDEDSLFGGETIVDSKSDDSEVSSDKKGLSFGGNFYNRSLYVVRRDAILQNVSWFSNVFFPYFQGDLFLDLRLDKGFKAYTSFSLTLYPVPISPGVFSIFNNDSRASRQTEQATNSPGNSTAISTSQNHSIVFNEYFLDFNIAYLAYFRIGKQILKWGRGFFWTPADIINIDKKTFTDLNRIRSGVNGMRFFLPIATVFNAYLFADMATDGTHSIALKAEVLLGTVEMALSYWAKAHRADVFAAEISTGILGMNVYAESAFSQWNFDERAFLNDNDQWILERRKKPSLKAVVGANKSFNDGKVTLGGEFFYNAEGYSDKDILKKSGFAELFPTGVSPALEHSQYYTAMFLAFSELFKKTTTFNLNFALNMTDLSLLLSPVLAFSPIQDFVLSITPSFYLGGNDNLEFTTSNIGSTIVVDFSFAL